VREHPHQALVRLALLRAGAQRGAQAAFVPVDGALDLPTRPAGLSVCLTSEMLLTNGEKRRPQ
jgi:hypothetical protein